MELLTTAAIALASVVVTTAEEKIGEKVGETLWQQTVNFLHSLKQQSPATVTAIEKASKEEPLDYGKAVLDVESAAKANPDVAEAMQVLVETVEADPRFQDIVNAIKSQTQQPNVINSQKLAESIKSIKNVFQNSTFIGGTF